MFIIQDSAMPGTRFTEYLTLIIRLSCLQCFDAVGWAAEGHACKKLEWWGTGMVITVSCFSKIQIGTGSPG